MAHETEKNIVRPPIVVVLGHVDHGKSTLLDHIRKSNTVAKEAGGITQHVAAYEITHADSHGTQQHITFLDTPGHQAFEKMRSRSASVADIAILVVSAEDGVQAQTREALTAITQQEIPYIVAINKIDKPNANVEKTINSLAEHEVYLEGRGGNTPYTAISAKTGKGVDELLELVLLVAELQELTGDPAAPAAGFVIESHRDAKKGIAATLLITDGTLTKGTYIVSGTSVAPTRLLENYLGAPIDTATLSMPVVVTGWSSLPTAGTAFHTYNNKKEAEAAAAQHTVQKPAREIVTEEDTERFSMPLIIKADVMGSIDAVLHELAKLEDDTVHLPIIKEDVGSISEDDVKTAGGSTGALIIGFRSPVDASARELADRTGVSIHTFDIIYELTDWLTQEIEKQKPKETVQEVRGSVTILKTFSQTKKAQVVGGRVTAGEVIVGNTVTILRRDEPIGQGTIRELQAGKTSVKKVEEGNECGIKIATTTTIATKDTLEAIA